MDNEEKALDIFNTFWLSSRMITRKHAIRLSVLHVFGIIEALQGLEQTDEIKAKISEYKKVKETIQNFDKK